MNKERNLNDLKIGDVIYSLICKVNSIEEYKKYKDIEKNSYIVVGINLEKDEINYSMIKKDDLEKYKEREYCYIKNEYDSYMGKFYCKDEKEYFEVLDEKLEEYKKDLMRKIEEIDKILNK